MEIKENCTWTNDKNERKKTFDIFYLFFIWIKNTSCIYKIIAHRRKRNNKLYKIQCYSLTHTHTHTYIYIDIYIYIYLFIRFHISSVHTRGTIKFSVQSDSQFAEYSEK